MASLPCYLEENVDQQRGRGFVYDCDFNQMLDLPLMLDGAGSAAGGERGDERRVHLTELPGAALEGNAIAVAGHCFGCTAGQGSSCGGALA